MAANDYLAQIGLAFDPFAANAMPEFFFVGGQRRFIVQRAAQATYFSGSTVLLLGAAGSGKTRVLDEIANELRDVTDICRIEATVLMDGTEARQQLAGCVGLASGVAISNADLILALTVARPAESDPHPILLIIDAAHLLSVDALTECAALAQSAGSRIRLLLAGEDGLATAWQQVGAPSAEALQLSPLSAVDTADYLHTRLQAAGCTLPMPIAHELLNQLFAQTGGNIGAIHRIAPQLLAAKASSATSNARTLPRVPPLHIGIAAVLLAVVILLAFYRGGEPPSEASTATIPAANPSSQKSIPLTLPTDASAALPEQASADRDSSASAANKPIDTFPAAPAPIEKPKPVVKEPIDNTIVKSRESAQTKPEAVPDSKIVPVNGAFSADEHALLALPPQQVVLQLIGAESRATIDKFAVGGARGVKLYVYRTRLRDKPWFIAVTGPYADRNAARVALDKLPPAVRKQEPWPRGVAAIQSDIKAHSGKR